MNLSLEDATALRESVKKLECLSFAMKAANLVGTPIEKLIEALPENAKDLIQVATRRAMSACLDMALHTLQKDNNSESSDANHKIVCTASGLVGGFFGFYALPVELPFSTAIMLRSIADIARSEGANLAESEAQLSCLIVFALGSPSEKDDEVDAGYYAARAALAGFLGEAVAQIGKSGGSALLRFITAIAERFGVAVSEKMAAQVAPIFGAFGGGAINLVFIHHFQAVASGHFTIRRLERKYSEGFVRTEYEKELATLRG